MSIADEIEALDANLQAAKTAVTTAGGTVGDTGLAGLADEIASIPTGGGGTKYGTVKIATDYTVDFGDFMADNCSVQITDAEAAYRFFVFNEMISFDNEGYIRLGLNYNSTDGWRDETHHNKFSAEELAENGFAITLNTGATYAQIMIESQTPFLSINDRTAYEEKDIVGRVEFTSLSYISIIASDSGGGGMGMNGTTGYIIAEDSQALKECVIDFSFADDINPTEIPDNFLANTAISEMTFPNTITKIGSGVMARCRSFTSNITIPASTTEIGNNFMRDNKNFNGSLTILSSNLKIGDFFLYRCSEFNSPLDLTGVVETGMYFGYQMSKFNSSVTFGNNLTKIGGIFLGNCVLFNQPITIPASLETLDGSFLVGCTAFNSPIDISHVTTLGANFLSNCTSFNQNITFSDNISIIYTGLMNNCKAFNKTLTLPASLDFSPISSTTPFYFMSGASKFTSLVVNCAPPTLGNNYKNYVLSTSTSSDPMYATGVTVTGTYASQWRSAFPNRTSAPYRKLI